MKLQRFTPLAVVAAALAVAAPAMSRSAHGSLVRSSSSITVRSSAYGQILFADRGRALYAFTRDTKGGRSTCSGACAAAWPPYLVSARPRATAGVRAPLLGTVRRSDGKLQATYGGRPLYFYVSDRAPGQVLCQNVSEFGGLWLVLRSTGKLVR